MGKNGKLIPIVCEICGNDNKEVLHKHHIVDRKDLNTSNHVFNLAVLCANCHNLVHKTNDIKIIGIYPSTKPPYNRTLVYEINGKSNAPNIKEPYYKHKPESMRIYERNNKKKSTNNV